jgi:AcrR family transcriptional regulator
MESHPPRRGGARRRQILDAAQRLLDSKGYEQMTIQELLDALQLSKGGFFHHFESKAELLEALVERWLDEAERILIVILRDPELSAVDKLQQAFAATSRWKLSHKEALMALLRGWYSDGNARARDRLEVVRIRRLAPLFGRLIHQGIQEGSFATAHPDRLGEVVLLLFQALGDAFARLLLAHAPPAGVSAGAERVRNAEQTIELYTEAVERVLGARAGSVHLLDSATIHKWFGASEDRRTGSRGGSASAERRRRVQAVRRVRGAET